MKIVIIIFNIIINIIVIENSNEKEFFLYLGALINEIEQGSIWFNDFSRAEWNMWNETGTFRPKFSRKIQNGPRFKMR